MPAHPRSAAPPGARPGKVGNMPLEADAVASALASVWEHLIAAVPGGWVRREEGMVGGVTGVSLPNLNGVWPEGVDLDEALVAAALDEIGSSGLPYCLQLRPGAPGPLLSLAARRGMTKEEPIPLMALDDADAVETAQDAGRLRIRQLAPEEALLHARIAARGFEAPEEPFAQLVTPEVLRRPGVRCYVGDVDGRDVTTCIGVTLGASVGIFNVATPPEHRSQGFGAAVTARAVADGLAGGARWSFLQSSAAGYAIYERLGYETVELWDCWVHPS